MRKQLYKCPLHLFQDISKNSSHPLKAVLSKNKILKWQTINYFSKLIFNSKVSKIQLIESIIYIKKEKNLLKKYNLSK